MTILCSGLEHGHALGAVLALAVAGDRALRRAGVPPAAVELLAAWDAWSSSI